MRNPSPVKLNASTAMKSAMPGKSVRCQYSSGLSNACRSSPPQLAVGGCTPNPRKLNPLSERIAPATPNVKLIRIGPVMFGSRCTVIVRHAEIPTTSQLWMYGSARCLSTSPRTRNVSPIHPVSPITAITTRIDCSNLRSFRIDIKINSSRKVGKQSRIMKAGNGKHYEQAYNAQAAVDTEGSMLIVGQYVTAHANDKQELPVAAASVDPAIREVDTVCADTGYFCEKAVLEVEDDDGPMVYCAVEKQSHHRTVEDLLKKAEPVPPPDDAPVKEKMAFRLKTQAGRTVYKKRKETVEPVFGIIKTILGFRGFLLRGLDKVSIEWDLITAAYNFKRLHKLCGGNLLEFTKILPQRS